MISVKLGGYVLWERRYGKNRKQYTVTEFQIISIILAAGHPYAFRPPKSHA